MKANQKSPVTYKRDKGKVEITGEAKQVKWQIWFDLISSRLLWVIVIIVLACTLPKTAWVPALWQWLKKYLLLLTPLLVAADFLMMRLSG